MGRIRRKISAGLPVWVEALFPQRLMRRIKEQLKLDGSGKVQQEHTVMRPGAEKAYEASQYHAEVFLHLSDEPGSRFGHMDIAFGRLVYSYGCYDSSSHRFFDMFSDGVLVVSPREAYIDYCLKQEKKVLIGYPLLLDQEQEEVMKQKLREFKKDLRIWRPNSFHYKHGEKVDISDAASKLQLAVGSRFFKVRRRKFKTYFVLGTNCALLVDECIGALGVERITPRVGIITPGACYRYFENALFHQRSIVAGRRVYLPDGGEKE